METKAQIRKQYKNKREKLTETETALASEKICSVILECNLYKTAESIGFYYPLGNEVRLNKVVEQAWQDGKKTFFPKVQGDNMEFYEISDFSQLEEGYFHVMEPVKTKVGNGEPKLVLVPGVVFDQEGNRAGYGKGYYDRYFAAHPDCLRLGTAYEMQLVQNLPTEPQDIRMQYLVTEKGIIEIGG